ncbi:MAG: glutathione-disulfide reductase [Hyphomicrobiales bacterium]|nr:glutathione-disulfide reductase [Hyphomicrobiales bacterium]
MAGDYDFVVLGGGSGGVRAARIASQHGARTAIVEEFRLGGTCVIRGCVPKKLYVYASRFADDFRDSAGFGWSFENARFDWPSLVAAKEKEISRLSAAYRANLEKAGVDIFETRGTFAGRGEIALGDGRRLRARHALVATGGRPHAGLDVPGIDLAIDSNRVFDLPKFPARLLVVGGGYIAVEFASLFARLGAEVALAFRADLPLRGFDADLRKAVADALARAGVALRAGVLPKAIRRDGDALAVALSDGSEKRFDQVLCAMGRAPNTAGLGLEGLGVALKANGAVAVDRYSATNVAGVHGVGDVTDRINLTPVAIREGHALADTLFGGKPTAVDHDHVPSAVFTTPELGTVGLSEEAARARFCVVDIHKADFRPMRATLSGSGDRTLMKLVVDGETDRVLGAHAFGDGAGEMAQLLAIPLRMGATKADFDATMALHPTAAEEFVTMRGPPARHLRAS